MADVRAYRPANGTEGDWFLGRWCDRCARGEGGCGACTLCCTVMKVTAPAFVKPAHETCAHCTSGGCAIYAGRPESCATFQCWWLGSQRMPEYSMPSNMRPDRTGVVLDLNSAGYVIAHCARPGAWKRAPMREWLLAAARTTRVLLELGATTQLLNADGSVEQLVSVGVDPKTNERLYVRETAA
ncbi:hypothetical protein [Sphingobium sp. DC-2]|uniref:hypothetical protein n=1 Tax=Sphingobium sp. DC-2 TaxID=1303256 RepID=UPI000AF1F5FB|nr:hypothetical protein [Sphingobium sp. DC-2]